MLKYLLLLFTFNTFAQTLETSNAKAFNYARHFRNYVKNTGAEKNLTGVNNPNSATSRSTSSPLLGGASFLIDTSGAVDAAEFTADNFDTALQGRNCEASFLVNGDASLYYVKISLNSAYVLTTPALPNTGSNTQRYVVNFPCSSLTSPQMEIWSSANGAAIKVDDVYIGEATSVNDVSQAQAIVHENKSGNQNIASAAATTLTTFTETLDVYNEFNATTGIFTSSGSKRIGVSGRVGVGNQNSSELFYVGIKKNGSPLAACDEINQTSASLVTNTGMHLSLCILDLVSGDTVEFYVDSTSDTNYDVTASGTSFDIFQFPTTSQTSIRPENQYWKVDANISGANPSLGTSAITSYTGIEDTALTLTNNSGSGNITAQIPCSSTNSPSGTTCSSGSESVGVAFTPTGTFPQEVFACASFSDYLDITFATGVDTYLEKGFQIVETPTNAQTISQEGKTRVSSSMEFVSGDTNTARRANIYPVRVCGNFTFSSGGQKVLRLMYEQKVGGTVNFSRILADALSTAGQRDIHWEVYPINQGIPAPILVGSVTSNTNSSERVERATVRCFSTSSISSQSGSWISSIGNISSGTCALTIASGIFSATPTCTASQNAINSGYLSAAFAYAASSTSITVGERFITGGSATVTNTTDEYINVICMGPR